MKKAGIITHYDVHNHGAHLQLYALSQCLRQFGFEAKALRFQKNYDFMGGPSAGNKYNISVRSIPIYFKYLVQNGASRTIYNYQKRKTLATFRNNYSLIGEYYSEAKNLDAVVIGSDEILSIEAGPNPWYYGIGIPCTNQIAYAASFGPTTLEMIRVHNVEPLVDSGLKHLKAIAVRDYNSAKIVEYYTNAMPQIVCDPVLLYDFPEQINEKAVAKFKQTQKKEYCIVYAYDYNMNDEETVTHICDYARRRGIKIYSIAYFHKWCDRNINLDPLDVLKWFSCADMVFTDTFHGSVISLATGAQFISKIRGNGNKLAYLLEKYGVSERKIDDFNTIEEIVEKPIDFNVVNETIKRIRIESLNYLKKNLE